MKSLADIAGISGNPNQKIAVNYSYNLSPDAKSIQESILSGEEPEGLIKATTYIVPDNKGLTFINDPKLRNLLEGNKPELLQTVNDYRLPEGYAPPFKDKSSEISTSVGGEGGEPAYLIPTFKYGSRLNNPIEEFNNTGQYLGGPFNTWQDAEKFQVLRHQYVEKGQPLPTPIATSNYKESPKKK